MKFLELKKSNKFSGIYDSFPDTDVISKNDSDQSNMSPNILSPHLKNLYGNYLEDSSFQVTPKASEWKYAKIPDLDILRASPLSSLVYPQDEGNLSFYQKLELARKKLTKKRKEIKNAPTKNMEHFFVGHEQSPILTCLRYLIKGNSFLKVWQKAIIIELASFTSTYIPIKVYKEIPHIKNKKLHFIYKRGMLRLIEASEKKIGVYLLSSSEKAAMLTTPYGYITGCQTALNRLYRYKKGPSN